MNARVSNLWIGWYETEHGSEIENLVRFGLSVISRFPYALITRIDSTNRLSLEMPSIFKILKQDHTLEIHPHGDSLLLPIASFIKLTTTFEFFKGFDEVWFLNSRPSDSLPQSIEFNPQKWAWEMNTGTDLSSTISKLEHWMLDSNAVLGVADGTGLGFATSDEAVSQAMNTLAV